MYIFCILYSMYTLHYFVYIINYIFCCNFRVRACYMLLILKTYTCHVHWGLYCTNLQCTPIRSISAYVNYFDMLDFARNRNSIVFCIATGFSRHWKLWAASSVWNCAQETTGVSGRRGLDPEQAEALHSHCRYLDICRCTAIAALTCCDSEFWQHGLFAMV